MKTFLYYIGKAKDPHANALAEDYIRRSDRYSDCKMMEIRPERFDLWAKHPTARKILLDPAGKAYDSGAFAQIFASAEMSGHDLVFVIGGHDGHPDAWKTRADLLVSLSAMTMPHELARAVLAEQIYRAVSLLQGHPYHRP